MVTSESIVVVDRRVKEPNPPVFVRPEVHTPTMFAAGICVRLAADIAGNVPVTLAAGTFVKFAADIAGSVPVIFAAGTFVKFAADIAGNAPVNFDAVTADNAESGTFVKLAPDPLNVVAVTIPAKSTPVSAKVTVPRPLRFSILLTLISDAIWVHFPPLF